MPKPSEIFDTPEATGFSRVGGNEEVVEEIGNLLQTGEYDKAVAYLHQQLQKARHVWLREKIVKLEWMKVKNEHNSECLHNEAPEYCDCDNYIKWNQALQTIIDYYQAELDTTSPVYKFFTAPEEVRRPAIEEALKKASQEQSELDQDVSK